MNVNPPQREIKLLIIDDNPIVASFVAEALRVAGFTFESRLIDNAADMTAALDSRSWDVVVSDYHMPSFTGLDALRLLRSRDSQTPFILLTFCPFPGLARAVDQAGGQGCLDKCDLNKLPDLLPSLLV